MACMKQKKMSKIIFSEFHVLTRSMNIHIYYNEYTYLIFVQLHVYDYQYINDYSVVYLCLY